MNIKKIVHAPLLLSIILLCGLAVQAEDLDLATKPLAVETGGVEPNIVLILDESGSMSNAGSYDVFYSPGYDADNEYRCINVAHTLQALHGNTVVVNVSKEGSTQGLPYFSYNGKYHTWGGNTQGTIDGTTINGGNVCFDPDETYSAKLEARFDVTGACKPNRYRYKTSRSGSWTSNQSQCPQSYHTCECTDNYTRLTADHNAVRTETVSGNYLNWYFSATEAEWANNTITGGYKNYSGSANDHGYWTEKHEDKFNTSDYGSGLSREYRGLKKGVSYSHQRLAVAKDVIKTLVRDITDANLAFLGYTSSSSGSGDNYPELLPLRHGMINFSEGQDQATITKKETMLGIVDSVTA